MHTQTNKYFNIACHISIKSVSDGDQLLVDFNKNISVSVNTKTLISVQF